jgi:hypothetical protein
MIGQFILGSPRPRYSLIVSTGSGGVPAGNRTLTIQPAKGSLVTLILMPLVEVPLLYNI